MRSSASRRPRSCTRLVITSAISRRCQTTKSSRPFERPDGRVCRQARACDVGARNRRRPAFGQRHDRPLRGRSCRDSRSVCPRLQRPEAAPVARPAAPARDQHPRLRGDVWGRHRGRLRRQHRLHLRARAETRRRDIQLGHRHGGVDDDAGLQRAAAGLFRRSAGSRPYRGRCVPSLRAIAVSPRARARRAPAWDGRDRARGGGPAWVRTAGRRDPGTERHAGRARDFGLHTDAAGCDTTRSAASPWRVI